MKRGVVRAMALAAAFPHAAADADSWRPRVVLSYGPVTFAQGAILTLECFTGGAERTLRGIDIRSKGGRFESYAMTAFNFSGVRVQVVDERIQVVRDAEPGGLPTRARTEVEPAAGPPRVRGLVGVRPTATSASTAKGPVRRVSAILRGARERPRLPDHGRIGRRVRLQRDGAAEYQREVTGRL